MKKTPKHKFLIVIIIVAILAVVAGGSVYFLKQKNVSSKNSEDRPTQSESGKTQEDGTPIGRPDPVPNQQASVNIDNIFSDANNIYFGVGLTNITSGTCELAVTQYGRTITKNGSVELSTSYYACNAMTISRNEVKQGKLTAKVTVKSNGSEYVSSEKEYDNQ